jgi:hypothetical protein
MATLEQLSAALVKADAAGNASDAKAFADEIRKMRGAAPEPKAPGMLSSIGQGIGNLAAGAVRGAGSIGATLLTPYDLAMGNTQSLGNPERRAGMDGGLQSLGAETDSWTYKGGKLAGEIAGTAGAGGALAQGVARVAPVAAQAPRAAQALEALRTGGFSLGGTAATTLGGKAAEVGVRAAGGAVSGGAQAGAIDPSEAALGAAIGGAFPLLVKSAGSVAGGLGDLVKYVKNPGDRALANKLAQSLGMTPEQLSAAVTQPGPGMIPGYQATVPQILQNPVASQLQRTLKTAGANALGDAEKVQQGQFRQAIDRVAPVDLTVQDAAARAGGSIQGYAGPARAQASKQVSALFESVDPFDQSALHLPIDQMQAASAKYLGAGTFGTGSKADAAINTAKQVGTQTLPAIKAIPQSAGQTQSLEQAVRSQGGIRPGEYLGREISELGRKQPKTTGLVAKTGRDIEAMATTMYERGFISDNDPATLLDMLRNGGGRGVYAADHVEAGFQRMADNAAGDLPGAETISKAVPFRTVQNLRSSMGEAAQQAEAKGANKEAAALKQMVKAIDDKINQTAQGGAGPGEYFEQDMVDTYRQALKAHADKMQKFDTGPQIGMFRQGGDGQASVQGAEIPGKFFSGRRSQVEDMNALQRLVGDQPAILGDMKRYATTEGMGTANVAGDLTSKYGKWLDARSGARRGLFSAQENATLEEVGKAVDSSINAESLGRVSGSDTAQKLEALNNLGLLDNKLVNILATRIPGVGAFTAPMLNSLKETAGQTRNNALSKLLASPQDLAQALKPGTAQSNALVNFMNKSGQIGARVAPAIAVQ